MSGEGACPDDDTLARFLAGCAPQTERDEIARHVQACSGCALILAVPDSSALTAVHGRPARTVARGSLTAERVLAGRYRIGALLGVGGMGEVYEAMDLSLGETVAIKTVRATIADNPRAVELLKSEVQLARRVTHPNVCRIFDFGVDGTTGDSIPFLTMELLRGTTLARWLIARGVPPPDQLVALARQISAGVQAAHSVGVIHKDLKSENVILAGPHDRATRAIVTDFGLAATRTLVDDRAGESGHVSGTLGYVAPERLAGRPATNASDVFAFGVVLLDLATGTLPARRGSTISVAPALAPLLALARRCQAPDPGERPPMEEVADALERLHRRLVPGRRRARAATWAVGALACAAGLVAALGMARPRAVAPSTRPAGPARAAPSAISAAAPPAPTSTALATPAPVAPAPFVARHRPLRPRRSLQPAVITSPPPAPLVEASVLAPAEQRLELGQIDEACALGQLAATRAPDAPEVWEFLGRCYMRLAEPRAARDYYRRYLALAPDGPKASLIRAIVARSDP